MNTQKGVVGSITASPMPITGMSLMSVEKVTVWRVP